MNRKIKTIFVLVVVGIFMGIVENAYTDEFKLTPSLAVKEEYNDNILYSQTNTEKDFITTHIAGACVDGQDGKDGPLPVGKA